MATDCLLLNILQDTKRITRVFYLSQLQFVTFKKEEKKAGAGMEGGGLENRIIQ